MKGYNQYQPLEDATKKVEKFILNNTGLSATLGISAIVIGGAGLFVVNNMNEIKEKMNAQMENPSTQDTTILAINDEDPRFTSYTNTDPRERYGAFQAAKEQQDQENANQSTQTVEEQVASLKNELQGEGGASEGSEGVSSNVKNGSEITFKFDGMDVTIKNKQDVENFIDGYVKSLKKQGLNNKEILDKVTAFGEVLTIKLKESIQQDKNSIQQDKNSIQQDKNSIQQIDTENQEIDKKNQENKQKIEKNNQKLQTDPYSNIGEE